MKKQIIFYAAALVIFIFSSIVFETGGFVVISLGLVLYYVLFLITKRLISYTYIPFILGLGSFAYGTIFKTGLGVVPYAILCLIGIGLGYLGAIIMIIYHIIRRILNKAQQGEKN